MIQPLRPCALLLAALLAGGCDEACGARRVVATRLGDVVRERQPVAWYEGARAHLAEVVRVGEQDVVRVDGRERGAYDHVRSGAWGGSCCLAVGIGPWLYPSPEGARWAHPAERGAGWLMVVDGVEGPLFDELRPPTWSADGKRVAYLGRRAASWHCVLDGQEGAGADGYQITGSFGNLPDMRFLPDGRLLYVPIQGRGPETTATSSRVSLDGVLGPVFDRVSAITVAARASTWAYLGQRGPLAQLVVDGAAVGEPLSIEPFSLQLSPDGQHVAYATRESEGRSHVVLDGAAHPARAGRVGWIALLDGPAGPRLVHAQVKGKETVLVDGDLRGAPHDLLLEPRLSPDGRRYACFGRRGEAWVLIVDGVERPELDTARELVWSPDSRRLAWDGRTRPPAPAPPASADPTLLACAGRPFFSADGARLAVLTPAPEGGQRFVIDGRPGPGWEAFVAPYDGSQRWLAFGADGTLRYVAVRDGALFAVEEHVR